MKLIGLKQAKARLSEFVNAAQHDRILITRRGRPRRSWSLLRAEISNRSFWEATPSSGRWSKSDAGELLRRSRARTFVGLSAPRPHPGGALGQVENHGVSAKVLTNPDW